MSRTFQVVFPSLIRRLHAKCAVQDRLWAQVLRKKNQLTPPVICHDTDCALAITCHHMPQHATTTFHNTKLRDVDGCCKCVTPILSSAGREGSAGVKKAGESSFTRPLSIIIQHEVLSWLPLFKFVYLGANDSDCQWLIISTSPHFLHLAHVNKKLRRTYWTPLPGAGISGLIAAHDTKSQALQSDARMLLQPAWVGFLHVDSICKLFCGVHFNGRLHISGNIMRTSCALLTHFFGSVFRRQVWVWPRHAPPLQRSCGFGGCGVNMFPLNRNG